jgi:hypothetical protein
MKLSRRSIVTGLASFAALPLLGRDARTAQAAEQAMPIYRVDLNELVKAFPGQSARASLPPLLSHLGAWMAGKPWRSIGAFDLALQWSDTGFVGGELHYDDFALFIRLPDGSAAGYWLIGRDPADSPIVLLGSEGDHAMLAPDLATLIARIAVGDFDDDRAASDFRYSGEDYGQGVAPDLRGDLQAFLRAQTGIGDLGALVHKARPYPADFPKWVAKRAEAYAAEMLAHPAMRAMASILDKYRPVNAQPWQTTAINLRWAGPHFDAWLTLDATEPLAEADQLEPHLATLRDEASAKKSGLGLWHRAMLMVYADHVWLSPDYIYEPDFRTGRPPAEAFKADQARAPREPRRIPPWLAAILAS